MNENFMSLNMTEVAAGISSFVGQILGRELHGVAAVHYDFLNVGFENDSLKNDEIRMICNSIKNPSSNHIEEHLSDDEDNVYLLSEDLIFDLLKIHYGFSPDAEIGLFHGRVLIKYDN